MCGPEMRAMRITMHLAFVLLAVAQSSHASAGAQRTDRRGSRRPPPILGGLRYLSIVPRSIKHNRVLVACPFGAQTEESAKMTLDNVDWRPGFERYGWLVLSPFRQANEKPLFDPTEKRLPGFLDAARDAFGLTAKAPFHLLGLCHGGRTAFRIAIERPERFRSLTVMPGFPHQKAKLARLKPMPINFVVGQHDSMRVRMGKAYRKLRQLGADVSFRVEYGRSHGEGFAFIRFLDLQQLLLRGDVPRDPRQASIPPGMVLGKPNTYPAIETAEEFIHLRMSSKAGEYDRAARAPAATEAVWWDVIRFYPNMRAWVIHNKTVPTVVLEALSTDADEHVRSAVGEKRKLPDHLFLKFARDPAALVRRSILNNKNAPDAALTVLRDDPNPDIARCATALLQSR